MRVPTDIMAAYQYWMQKKIILEDLITLPHGKLDRVKDALSFSSNIGCGKTKSSANSRLPTPVVKNKDLEAPHDEFEKKCQFCIFTE